MSFKEKVFNMLPVKIKKIRWTYVKGKISNGTQNDFFFYDARMIEKLRVESYSQYGQDAFIYHLIWGGAKCGFFLDIGGNDPIDINNSYLFEKNGWSGIAFEPVKSLADKWKKYRETPCYNVAIGDTESEIEFTEAKAHQLSGIGVNLKDENVIKYKICQKRLTDILDKHGIRQVDVAFIDVEGYEMNVLKGIDFDKISITCICIENNRYGDISPNIDLRMFLINKGYVLIGRLTIDDVFVKESYFTDLQKGG